jgi:RNA polymerase sporulation-specific sigma factor
METDSFALIRQAQAGSEAACAQLVRENSALVWSIARRFFGRGVDPEDLYQLGCVGFLKAVRGFDTAYGTRFSTYAVPKISGEIRRFLRDDGAVKVSRGMKERARAVHLARCELEQALGREPTLSEMSAKTGMSPEELATAEAATGMAESLQRPSGETEVTLEQVLGDDGQEERLIERFALDAAMEALPERERMVIALRFFHGLTQDKTAKVLGFSQVQVSRLERRALEAMRAYMMTAEV